MYITYGIMDLIEIDVLLHVRTYLFENLNLFHAIKTTFFILFSVLNSKNRVYLYAFIDHTIVFFMGTVEILHLFRLCSSIAYP